MAKNEYSETDENGKKIDVKVVDYDLPFYHFQRVSKRDPSTGKMKVEKKLVKKPFEEMMSDVLIVSASATAINLIGNGLSHFIYALKKKKK